MFFERLQNLLSTTSKNAQARVRKGKGATTGQRPKNRRPLRLETLEDRTVPTVLFAPQFGNESFAKDGGQRINSPNVYVVLWGHSWGSINSANSREVFLASSGVLANHYLDGIAQYGVTTDAHYKQLVFDDTTDPVTGFSQLSMRVEIERLVANGQLPDPANTPNMIVTMVTAPGITSDLVGAAGYNTTGKNGDGSFRYGIIWNATASGDGASLADHFSLTFSHEMAEIMTDPDGKGFELNKGAKWTLSPPESTPNQIADFEGNRYSYRSNGSLVQPYWSRKDNQWLVTDGNAQIVLVKPNWTKNRDGTQKNFVNYDVTVNGGQRPGADALTVGSFSPSHVPPGIFINLNGEFFAFDSSQNLGMLTATVANGVVQVDGTSTLTGVTINGRRATKVDIFATDSPVTIKTAGTATVGRYSLDNIKSTVTIAGGAIQTDLTITDTDNARPNSEYQILDNYLNRFATGSNVNVGYSSLRSLRINGGSGGNDYGVFDTPSASTTLNTGGGNDRVTVRGTTGSLGVRGQGGRDTVTIGYNGTVRGIEKALVVSNQGGSSSIIVDDSQDNAARTAIVYSTRTLGVPYIVISGLTPGGDISLRDGQLSSLLIRTGSGGNTYRIHDTPFSFAAGGAPTTVDTGLGKDLVTVDGTSGPLTVNGQSGADTVNIGAGYVPYIASSLTVTNSLGFSAVNVNDTADKVARTAILYKNGSDTILSGLTTGGDIVLRSAELSSLGIRTGNGGTTFRIHDTPTSLAAGGLTTTVATGAGADLVTIDGTRGTLVLDAQGGDDTVRVGSPNADGRVLDFIRGAVTIGGSAGNDALTFIDQGTTTREIYSLVTDQLTRKNDPNEVADMAPVSFASFKTVTLNASGGGSTVFVDGTAAGTTTTVNGQPGVADVFAPGFSFDMSNILGPVRFNGQTDDHDFAYYYDYFNPNPQTYDVSTDPASPQGQLVKSTGAAPVTFNDLNAIIFAMPSVGGSKLNIKGVPAQMVLLPVVGNGDAVRVGSRAPNLGGTLANILGSVAVDSSSPDNVVTLVVDDSGNADLTPKHVTLTPADRPTEFDQLVGFAPGTVQWRNFGASSSITLRGGAADESFALTSTNFAPAISIDGGGGVNALDYSRDAGPTAGLVSWYKAEGDANDSVGGNNGIAAGDVQFAEGKVGQAFSFNGVDSYVQVPNSPALESAHVSVEAWVNGTNLPLFVHIMAKGDNGFLAPSYSLSTWDSGGLRFQVSDGTTQATSPDPGAAIWDGNWHHVVGTYDGASVRLYVDGAEVGSGTPTNIAIGYGLSNTNDLFIGSNATGEPRFDFHGLVDELSVYNRALSAADVQSIYSAGSSGKSGVSYGVEVNLSLGTSTGLTGGITKIQNVIGSAGDDILVGNGGNVLTGGAGRDLLIAGATASILNGGDDEDILIGGTTDYDTNAAALMAIMAEWSSAADYGTRIANLKNGTNGAPILNATTVRSHGGGNTLWGNAGQDFFYANVDLDTLDIDPLTEDLVAV